MLPAFHSPPPRSSALCASPGSGEHTPPACGFRRRAENLVPQTSLRRQFREDGVARVWARRPNWHAGGVCSPFSPNSEVGTESVVWGRLSSLPVRATFQSPDTELESSVNRQTRMSALQALGSVPARPSSEFGFRLRRSGSTPEIGLRRAASRSSRKENLPVGNKKAVPVAPPSQEVELPAQSFLIR